MKKPTNKPAKFILRELGPSEITSIYSLIAEHNPGLSKATFNIRLKEMLPLGYRAVAAFEGKKMVAVSGFWVGMRFWCGRTFDVDNFIVSASYRRSGLGAKLLAWLETKALAEKAELIVLDAYADSFLAHRFYFRHGFVMTGYHMTKIPGNASPFVPVRKR